MQSFYGNETVFFSRAHVCVVPETRNYEQNLIISKFAMIVYMIGDTLFCCLVHVFLLLLCIPFTDCNLLNFI